MYIFSTVMNPAGKQISRLFLSLLFLVFNVGVPILVDSCPMPKPACSMMCPFCRAYDSLGGPVIKGKPCCSSSVAAEKNTNEFLTAEKAQVVHPPAPCAFASVLRRPFPLIGREVRMDHPRFAPDDIPILFSSLLI